MPTLYQEAIQGLRGQTNEMQALIGRRAQFDESPFTHAPAPVMVEGQIASVILEEGVERGRIRTGPHWRVIFDSGINLALKHITVLSGDLA